MTKTIAILLSLIVAVSAQAKKVSDYVIHQKFKGSMQDHGSPNMWNIDYVQLIPRAGHPLSQGDLKINPLLRKTHKKLNVSIPSLMIPTSVIRVANRTVPLT